MVGNCCDADVDVVGYDVKGREHAYGDEDGTGEHLPPITAMTPRPEQALRPSRLCAPHPKLDGCVADNRFATKCRSSGDDLLSILDAEELFATQPGFF
jgi:hypothetical protein